MSDLNKIPLVVIVGPTASGKTSLSIEVAKALDGEIVSADSMQIYKGMDIATAKPTSQEQQGVKHHLIDFLDVSESFSVAQYCELAHECIKDIYDRGKLPILVGGTGLYIDSLINNVTFSKADSNEMLREELMIEYEQKGVDYLLDVLREFDEQSAIRLSVEKNPKRIIRAIEIFKTTGITMTEHNLKSHDVESPYKTVIIGLNAENREVIYDRINKRVDIMVENGLVNEAEKHLDVKHSNTAAMAIGHKELLPFFGGERELDYCIENLKMQTRRYAKRQLTWFNRNEDIHWFYLDNTCKEDMITKAIKLIKKELFNEE
ncbi:MAG: tRNA (adenosine(37)-N6)-dimethylallyltransferase MiaA [Ruminococcus sp.]|nr:tRNA (adenosine(37)-N6)-dimethylallyltransferase MiaA [Ruminococcus sp.]